MKHANFGFQGKILIVDLTSRRVIIEDKDISFYRKYLGGSFLAARLFAEHTSPAESLSAFSEKNPVVFATGPMAGKNICGMTRVNILSLSPETPGIYTSQAGGEFGPDIKRAGFDAMVITGKAPKPVYLVVENDTLEFHNAGEYWGNDRLSVHQQLTNRLSKKFTVATIGPAAENRVFHSNIMFEPDHFAGRGGLGAVMGSKNLKAICIRGDQRVEFKDPAKLNELNQRSAKHFKESFDVDSYTFSGILRRFGTFGLLAANQAAGNIPVNNFKYAHSEDQDLADQMAHPQLDKQLIGRRIPCRGCYIACKKRSKINSSKTALPEYESIALLSTNLGIQNLEDGIKACDLCNALGMDTMSTGNMIAYLMDCYENGVLSHERFNFSIKFGDVDAVLRLIDDMAYRKGELGELLANGINQASQVLGEQTRQFLRFSKGIGIPAHLPRTKPGVGFGYLHGPNPADHMKMEHDWIASDPKKLKEFGITMTSSPCELDTNKVEIARATQIYYSAIDCLSACIFVFGPGHVYSFDAVVDLVNAATGFGLTFSDLMRIGESAIQLHKKLFIDFGGADESFISFLSKEIPSGPTKGFRIRQEDFEKAREHYYKLWNWDKNGRPTNEVLERLGLND